MHKAAINRLSPGACCVLACEIPSEEYLENIDVKKLGYGVEVRLRRSPQPVC
jgi:hypothetical protein